MINPNLNITFFTFLFFLFLYLFFFSRNLERLNNTTSQKHCKKKSFQKRLRPFNSRKHKGWYGIIQDSSPACSGIWNDIHAKTGAGEISV